MAVDCPVKNINGRIIDIEMSNIEKILHSKKLNYEDLEKISNEYFCNFRDGKTINIFIDLYDIVKQFYKPDFSKEMRGINNKGKKAMITELINIVSHYRHFFYSRYRNYTTIVFYYSNIKDEKLLKIDSNYKKEFYNKRIDADKNSEFFITNKVLKEVFKVLTDFLYYIPHAYVINTLGVEPSMFPSLFMNNKIGTFDKLDSKDVNIIMSNEQIYLLDVFNSDTTLLFKNKGREKSLYVDQLKAYDVLQKDYKEILESSNTLPSESLYYIFALSGYKKFSIPNVKNHGIKKSIKYLDKKLSEGKNIISYNSEDNLKDLFNGFKEDEIKRISMNLNLINRDTYTITKKQETDIEKQFIDIIDINELKKAIIKHFNTSIILIDYLFEGENEN